MTPFTTDFIIAAIGLIIAAILGYLLGRRALSGRVAELESDLERLRREHKDCENNLSDCNRKLRECEARKAKTVVAPVAAPVVSAVSNFDADAAKAAFGKKIKQDDLKIVEGIGPKIEGIFNNGGIKTWSALAATSADKLKSLLNAAGPRYQMHNPSTWPKQSGLAAEGKFAELKKWQDELDGGK